MRNITDEIMRPHTSSAGQKVPGTTYRFVDPSLVDFPFGYGMTYGKLAFQLQPPATQQVSTEALLSAWKQYYNDSTGIFGPTFKIQVTNTGSMATELPVLGFSARSDGLSPRQLFGFQRQTIAAGASKVMEFSVPAQALTLADADGKVYLEAGTYDLELGGEPDGFVQAQLVVQGNTQEVWQL